MIGATLLLLGQALQLDRNPPAGPYSRPLFDVDCQLNDVLSDDTFRLAFKQSGGQYVFEKDGAKRKPRGRLPVYAQVVHDDFGIFGSEPIKMIGNVTNWHSDGDYELVSPTGQGIVTFHKTTEHQAFLSSPTVVAVTAEATYIVQAEGAEPERRETLLSGRCDVSFEKQDEIIRASAQSDGVDEQ